MNAYHRLVNRQFTSAKLLLGELASNNGDQRDQSKNLHRVFLESALHALSTAYLCHLRAIADNYHCIDVAAINDIQLLTQALSAVDRPSPEAAEIQHLMNEAWLGECLAAQRQLSLPEPVASYNGQADIILVDSQVAATALSSARIKLWMDAFSELTQRHRETMAEY